MWKELKNTNKRSYIVGVIVLFVLVLLALGIYCVVIKSVLVCENEYYHFSYPKKVSIETREFSDYIEADLYTHKKIGGIDYYPLSDWDDFHDRGPWDADVETFLKEQGILRSDEDLDSYMLDIGTTERSATLWESRSDIEREHFLVFTESGHCYDLWFYCDKLDDSDKELIIESFQLEVSI